MLKSFGISALAVASLIPGAALASDSAPVTQAVYHPGAGRAEVSNVYYVRRARRHPVRKTIKRVGIGAAGGAAVGALVGGGPGAAIGAVAGGGAGAIYDHHEKRKGN